MLPWANFLHAAGFSVFTYDPRGRGKSGGTTTFGVLETEDLISAVTVLSRRRDVDRHRIGALGVSQGAAVSILAAATDRRIKAVVDDSGFSDERDTNNPDLWHALLHPRDPDALIACALTELRTGIRFGAVRPVNSIALIAPRPIFIIQGMADRIVPLRDSAANFAAAGRPKQIWWVPGAGHGRSLFVAGPAYRQRVVAFFRGALHV